MLHNIEKKKKAPLRLTQFHLGKLFLYTFQGMSCISEEACSSTALLCVPLARLKPRNHSALSMSLKTTMIRKLGLRRVTTLLGTRVHKPCRNSQKHPRKCSVTGGEASLFYGQRCVKNFLPCSKSGHPAPSPAYLI